MASEVVVTLRVRTVRRDRTGFDGEVVRAPEELGRMEKASVEFAQGVPAWVRRDQLVRVWGLVRHAGRTRMDLVGTGSPNPVEDLTDADLRVLAAYDLRGVDKEQIERVLEAVGVRLLSEAWGAYREDPAGFRQAAEDACGEDAAGELCRWFAELERNVDLAGVAALLERAGLDLDVAMRVWDSLRHRAARAGVPLARAVRENPWLIAQAEGVTFAMAEELARSLGVAAPEDDPRRVDGAVMAVLLQRTREGHACMGMAELIRIVASWLGVDGKRVHALVREALARLEQRDADRTVRMSGALRSLSEEVEGGKRRVRIYAVREFFAESWAVRSALRLAGVLPPEEETAPLGQPIPGAELERLAGRAARRLTEEQRKALRALGSSRIVLVHGRAGTGKTELVAAAVRAFRRRFGEEAVRITAPTGVAALRAGMRAGVPVEQSGTMHRVIRYCEEEHDLAVRERKKPLWWTSWALAKARLLVVDEAGMASDHVLDQILRAAERVPGLRVLLVGDPGQCPSILPGGVFEGMCAHPAFAGVRYELTEVHRTGRWEIVENANRIRDGRADFLESPGVWELVEADSATDAVRAALRFAEEEPDGLVLGLRYGGEAGVDRLNRKVRALRNPGSDGPNFAPGDRVIALENEYGSAKGPDGERRDVLNGLLGCVLSAEGGRLSVGFAHPDGALCTREYSRAEAGAKLRLAYALTPWKAQGAEADAVAVVWSKETDMRVFDRRVLYTAVTRARRRVVLIGPRDAWSLVCARPGWRANCVAQRIRNALREAEEARKRAQWPERRLRPALVP